MQRRVPHDEPVQPGEVSNFLYDNLFRGDQPALTTPFDDLVQRDGGEPLFLISAGIGCTPMIGMLNHLVDTDSQRRVDILHADRTPAALAHRSELMDLVSRLPRARAIRWYEDPGQRTAEHGVLRGRVDLDQVSIAPDVRAYLCGQLPFMTGVRDALIARRVPRERIHYEVFGPEDRSRRAS